MLMPTQNLSETTDAVRACKLFPTRQILIAADGSMPSTWALQAAGRLASQFDCDQNIVYVAEPLAAHEPELARFQEESDAARLDVDQRLLDALPGQRAEGRSLRRLLRRGRPVDEILGAATQTQPDLLIIGTHGRHGLKRLLLGSVATDVIRHATCPVLCVNHPPAPVLGRRIVLGVDFDEASQIAARWAGEVARRTGGQIMIVHAVPPPAMVQPGYGLVSEDLMQRQHRLANHMLQQFRVILPPECDPQIQLADGSAGPLLAETAAGWNADLIVVGHTNSTVLKRTILGSTTESVLQRSACPVLCVTHDPHSR